MVDFEKERTDRMKAKVHRAVEELQRMGVDVRRYGWTPVIYPNRKYEPEDQEDDGYAD